jgi:hypothetical protein
MRNGLQILYRYHDADIVEVEITVGNGRFSGSANVYLSPGELTELANILSGFPSRPTDTRDYTLGTFEPGIAGGAVRLNFYLKDLAGHASLRCFVKDDGPTAGHTQRSEVVLDIEPAALDRFISELRMMERDESSASLIG